MKWSKDWGRGDLIVTLCCTEHDFNHCKIADECCVFGPTNGCSAHCLLVEIISFCVKASFFILFHH